MLQVVNDRLSALEADVASVQQQLQQEPRLPSIEQSKAEQSNASSSRCLPPESLDNRDSSRNESKSTRDLATPAVVHDSMNGVCASRQTLVSGPKVSVTGFEAMNAAAYALQFCRFRRSEHGIVDAATGKVSPYAQLVADVQRVSESLRTHGFREGAVARVCSHAATRSLLVLTLSVWNLVGTIEVDSAVDDGIEDLGAPDETARSQSSRTYTGHWLVCDAIAHVERHCSHLAWTPEKIITIESRGSRASDSSDCIAFADLLASDIASSIALSRVRLESLLMQTQSRKSHAIAMHACQQVPSDAVALRVLHSDDSRRATSFTHFQVIESVERSLQGLSSELLGSDSAQSRVVVNALPFNHSGCLCVGLLPAIVLDVSVLPLSLSPVRPSLEDLAKHFAAHNVRRWACVRDELGKHTAVLSRASRLLALCA